MSDELLPCPFCGESDDLDFENELHWEVVCGMCNARIGMFETKEDAAAAWNAREQTPLEKDMLAALKGCVMELEARAGFSFGTPAKEPLKSAYVVLRAAEGRLGDGNSH